MKFFWPRRLDVKGFSIDNVASKYGEKTSRVSSNKVANQLLDNSNFKSTNEDNKYKTLSHLSIKKGHWANRDFSEYKQAA